MNMNHGDMDHGSMDGGFMSMAMMTKDLPRSRDGLAMEDGELRIEPPHPAAAPDITLHLTLDGDTVRSARFQTMHNPTYLAAHAPEAHERLAQQLVRLFDVLGHPRLQRHAAALQRAFESGDIAAGQRAAQHMDRYAARDLLLRWRLQGLATVDGKDAYARLREMLKALLRNAHKEPRHLSLRADAAARLLPGLELADALAAVTSFIILPPEDKKA